MNAQAGISRMHRGKSVYVHLDLITAEHGIDLSESTPEPKETDRSNIIDAD